MLNRIKEMFVAPVTDEATRRTVREQTLRAVEEANRLSDVHLRHRTQNHLAQRLAVAYRSEPRWK